MKSQDGSHVINKRGDETNPKKTAHTRSPQLREKKVLSAPNGVLGHRLATLSLTALGVVFGDIATSPLYAIRECFHGEYGITVTPENLLGVLSLMLWALLVIVTLNPTT